MIREDKIICSYYFIKSPPKRRFFTSLCHDLRLLTLIDTPQVTAYEPETRGCVEAAGGRITRVYYTMEGLGAILRVSVRQTMQTDGQTDWASAGLALRLLLGLLNVLLGCVWGRASKALQGAQGTVQALLISSWI